MTRYSKLLLFGLLVAFLGQSAVPAQQAAPTVPVSAVGAIGMTVSDLDRSVEFYSQVLSFQKISDVEVSGTEYDRLQGIFGVRMRVVRMQLGDEQIELTDYLTPRGRPAPVDARSNDRSFQHVAIIVSDMDQAYQRLLEHRVEHVSPEPQRLPDWNPNAGGIRAFYFRDPDDHALEILQFPSDKGAAKWHRPSKDLFLGIDHTAIVVSDTDESLRFYRDALGFEVGGQSLNYGPEQERLNHVFGARLRITGLHVGDGPGIEFLEYLSPRDGRPMPQDERANDLMHWQTSLVSSSLGHLLSQPGRFELVFSGVVSLPDAKLGFRRGALIRDPDGHVLQLVEK